MRWNVPGTVGEWSERQSQWWLVPAVAFGLLVLAACSGGDDPDQTAATATTSSTDTTTPIEGDDVDDAANSDASDTTDTDDTAPLSENDAGPSSVYADTAPPTTLPLPTRTLVEDDADTGEGVEVEVPAPGPADLDAVVQAGVDAGIWSEAEGVARALDYAVGLLPADQVPGAKEISSAELTGLLVRAERLVESGEATPDELALLEQRLSLLAPSGATLDEVANQARALSTGFAMHPRQAAECEPVSPNDWDSDAWITGCYQVETQVLPDATLRVFYPFWYLNDLHLTELVRVTMGALTASIDTYRNLGSVGNIDVIFSATDTVENEDALASASASYIGDVTDNCQITLFPISSAESLEAFEQTVAHEAWHCTQYYDGMVWSDPDWVVEGGAEFFSNVVYPSHNDEHTRLWVFDSGVRTPLYEMSYEAWIWWQHLSNEFSPLFVADAHRAVYGTGGIGVEPLGGMEQVFHDFTADFVAGVVQDQNGQNLPRGRYKLDFPVVDEDDEGRVIEHQMSSWVALRWRTTYDAQLRILQTDQTSEGLVSMVKYGERSDRAAWEGVFPEVRSKCRDALQFAGVVTDARTDLTASDALTFMIMIDEIEKAECDPCLLGTWSLDLETFEQQIITAAGGSLPSGAEITFGGAYYLAMDEESMVTEQRDGLEMTTTIPGTGSISILINSFATGEYSADGENIALRDMVESFNEVKVNIPFGGTFNFPGAVEGGAGTYECDEEMLVLAPNGLPPATWNRVDRILQPPDAPTDDAVAEPTDA